MIPKPIGPRAHGAIDYAFATLNLLAPTFFNLKGTARTLCYLFGAGQGTLNALTDHPLGLKKLVPLRVHGQVEVPYVPALLLLPIATGVLQDRTARFYFGFLFATSLANFLLSNYNAYEPQKPAPNP